MVEKKGLGPLAWLAIVAGVLLLVVGVGVLAGGYFLFNKAREFSEDAGNDPALMAARLAVMANPDLSIVDSDSGRGTLTVRNDETGEEITVSFEDITEGRLTFETAEGTVSLDADGERMAVTGPDGSVASVGGADGVPDWVPVYPGTAAPRELASVDGPDGAMTTFQVTTEDTPDQILAYYEDLLPDEGFELEVARVPTVTIIEATDGANGRTLGITIPLPGDKGTVVLYQTQQRPVTP